MSFYPVLVRNQYHNGHDYTVRLSDTIEVRWSEEQLLRMREQIEQDQKPLNRDDFYPMPGTYRDKDGHVRPLSDRT